MLKPRNVCDLICRLYAMYFVFTGINLLLIALFVAVGGLFSEDLLENLPHVFINVTIGGGYLVSGFLILCYSSTIGNRMIVLVFPEEEVEHDLEKIDVSNIFQRFVFGIAGLVIVFLALEQVFYTLANVLRYLEADLQFSLGDSPFHILPQIGFTVTMLVVGGLLLYYSKHIVQLLNGSRTSEPSSSQ